MSSYIYVLKLQKDKYYVGRTKDVWLRMKQHFNGNGAKYTKIYKPLAILEVYESFSRFDQDNQTKRMMEKYTINNVRGGSYTSEILSQQDRKVLEKELKTLTNSCFKCGKIGHYSYECSGREIEGVLEKRQTINKNYLKATFSQRFNRQRSVQQKEDNRERENKQDNSKRIFQQYESDLQEEIDQLYQSIKKNLINKKKSHQQKVRKNQSAISTKIVDLCDLDLID